MAPHRPRTFVLKPGTSTTAGWFADFTGGERLVTDPTLAPGILVFNSNIPSTTACMPPSSSYFYAVDYETGGQPENATYAGISLGSALASRPVLVQLPNHAIKAISRLADIVTITTVVPAVTKSPVRRRVSWRELIAN